MVNYQNSMIYKLCCKNTNIEEIYIGSTTNFKRRKDAHKCSCINEHGRGYNLPVYQFIRANGGFHNWDMVLIEKVNCNDKMELHKIEREYIEKTKNNLNRIIPTRTVSEYKKDNKIIIKEKSRIYNEKNKNKEKERNKIYREKNKDIINEKAKKTYEKNKDKYKEQRRIYREKNKDIIDEKRKEKINCECGSTFRKDNITKHIKTIKHQKYIKEKELILNV